MYNWRMIMKKQLLGTVLLSTFLLGHVHSISVQTIIKVKVKRIMKKVVNIVQVSLKTSRVIKIPRQITKQIKLIKDKQMLLKIVLLQIQAMKETIMRQILITNQIMGRFQKMKQSKMLKNTLNIQPQMMITKLIQTNLIVKNTTLPLQHMMPLVIQ